MKLCDLTENITIQGNVEIRVIDDDGTVLDEDYIENTSELLAQIGKFRDFEVSCMFTEKFTRRYPNSTKEIPYLIIELEEKTI